MAGSNILREMFVKIGVKGDKDSKKKLGLFKRALKSIVGDIKVFKANLASIATASLFGALNRGFQGLIRGTKELIKESSTLAAIQEDSENRLRSAMEIAGDFSQSEFDGLKRFASGIQEISTVGDEAALSGLAVAKAFGATNEQAKQIVEAAVNFSSATGKSFNESLQQMSKTLGGFAGELGEVSPAIKALTMEELKAGKAAAILNAEFGGIAKKNLRSFSAQFIQLKNIIGDAFEQVGAPINDVLLPAIAEMKIAIVQLQPFFTQLGQAIARSFLVVQRIFKELGGKQFLGDTLTKVSRFILDMALLVEDFFLFMSGKPSFLGQHFGIEAGDIGGGLASALSSALASILPTILTGIGDVILGIGSKFKDEIALAFKGAGMALVETIQQDAPILGNILSFIGRNSKFARRPDTISKGDTTNNDNRTNIDQKNIIHTSQAGRAADLEIQSVAQQNKRNGTR